MNRRQVVAHAHDCLFACTFRIAGIRFSPLFAVVRIRVLVGGKLHVEEVSAWFSRMRFSVNASYWFPGLGGIAHIHDQGGQDLCSKPESCCPSRAL